MFKIIQILFLFLFQIQSSLAGCETLEQVVSTTRALENGSYISFSTNNGITISGTYLGQSDYNGQKIITLMVDGKTQSHYVESIVPSTLVTPKPRMQPPVRGSRRPMIASSIDPIQTPPSLPSSARRRAVFDGDSIPSHLRTSAPTTFRQETRILVPVDELIIEGRTFKTTGEESFITLRDGTRAKIVEMKRDTLGSSRLIDIEITDPRTGLKSRRSISGDELTTARQGRIPILPSSSTLIVQKTAQEQAIKHSDLTSLKGGYFGEYGERYLRYVGKRTDLVDQGFKLHVSATLDNYADVAEVVLPILKRHKVNHKIARSKEAYISLGEEMSTQVGKFITIYPDNNQQAVLIAKEVDEAISRRGLTGIQIPSERRLGKSGAVFTRYGQFNEFKPFRDPQGRVIQDIRGGPYKPDWADDPFTPAGL